MMLARLLSKIYKKNGIVLMDSKGQKYICGQPNLKKPITVKKDTLATKCLEIMQSKKITKLIVGSTLAKKKVKVLGIISIHHILQAGIK